MPIRLTKKIVRDSKYSGRFFETLVDLLQFRAQHQSSQIVYRFLKDGEREESILSYHDLDHQARTIAAQLQEFTRPGERALLLYPSGLDYISAFFGCLYAGVVAVPAYPPNKLRNLPRIKAIVADSESTVVLTTAAILAKTQKLLGKVSTIGQLRWFTTDTLTNEIVDNWHQPQINSKNLAFLQYTSGSTGSPKGVMVSHGNIMSNEEMIRMTFQNTPSDIGVGWLPLFHDMGLIGNVLQPVYSDFQVILMSPAAFLQRPVRWLRAISKYQATTSGGPNFAYELCIRKISHEERAMLDLSSWRLAFNGAEPVRAATLDDFSDAFSTSGFCREAFLPCYGLAEASLLVSGGPADLPPVVFSADGTALDQNRIVPVSIKAPNERRFVGCGSNAPGQHISIVNLETFTRCAPDKIGEIWVAGKNISEGYWGRANETKTTFHAYLADTGEGPFLRTGDLGFLWEGNLVVTGRVKDLIILHGRNIYPQDVELTVEQCHSALRPGSGAAFSVEINNHEQLVVVQELEPRKKCDFQQAVQCIRQAIAEEHEIQVYHVMLIKPGTIPKTSSGKIQRGSTCAMYLDGELKVISEWRASSDTEDQISTVVTTEQDSIIEFIPDHDSILSVVAIKDWLITQLSRQVGLAPSEIDIHQPFTYYGLGSIECVEMAGKLEGWLGCSVPPTLVWDYPNINAIAQHLSGETVCHTNSATQELTRNGEPIAIIGIGCRFPGAPDVSAFWELLHSGTEAITEVPPDRWDSNVFYDPAPATPGKMDTRWGGFLDHVDKFEPEFFGISPREAERMDPQQRLLLEVSWEALEDAGQVRDQLAGSQTGVFVGISSSDYYMSQFREPRSNDAYSGTGNAFSVAANRISYLLDLQGPSIAVDTACSSSLVAVDLACDSLRNGKSDLALAGGVNLTLSPQLTISFSQARMLSPKGHCKTFDAEADGYVRGEGCGIVVLKRLSDAIANGDRILAVIRGSAINQDGRSNGLTAPNGLAQQAVIRLALSASGAEPSQISYVEAHGTGTPLGDSVELRALTAVYGRERSKNQPLVVGSVKTNIGHLEAAAGIASLIKVVLALQHKEIPPHLNLKQLNPHIPLDDIPLIIPTEQQTWSVGAGRRLAGVSSFGFGGTNAHVIIEEAPAPAPVTMEVDRPLHLLTLSAKTEEALKQLSLRYADHLAAHPDVSLGDVCYTANTGRSHFSHRLALTASTAEGMGERLSALASGDRPSGLSWGQVSGNTRPKIAFLFTGQGSQYIGMGRLLYETQPTFRKVLDRCDALLRPYQEEPLLSVLYPESEDSLLLDETAYTQPALFSLGYALSELWQSWGIHPSAVLGHSVGEYVAACVAGVFSLEDGLKLISERARLMQSLPRTGEMVAVLADESRVLSAIKPYLDKVSLAGINGPESMVISGQRESVEAVKSTLEAEGVKTKRLQVSHAFHSPLMDPMLSAFEDVARGVTFSSPRTSLISNVIGQGVTEEIATPGYWCRHIRQPVRFFASMQTLHAQGYEVFIELGPKPTLLGMGRLCLPEGVGLWLPSLRPGQSDWQSLLQSLGELYLRGVSVDGSGFDRDYDRRRVALPTYPFQRQRYWVEMSENKGQAATPSFQESAQSDIVRLLDQGETQQLSEILEQSGRFPEETRQHLPEIVDVLIRHHQRQVTASSLKDWLYELAWQPKPIRQEPASEQSQGLASGSWLIFADQGGVGQAVSALLKERGQNCLLVFPGEVYASNKERSWSLNPTRPEDFDRLFQEAFPASAYPLSGVLHLWSLDAAPWDALTLSALEDAQSLGCGSALHLVQSLVKHAVSGSPRLWLVTSGAVPVGGSAESLSVAQSPLWGLGKVVSLEHPELWGGLVDLSPNGPEAAATSLFGELLDSQGEDQVAFREGQRYVARLVRSSPPAAQGVSFQSDVSYLITGGLGALGLKVAQWMVDQGARHVVLTGRRGASHAAQEILSSLEEVGAQVIVAKADVSNEQDMVRVFEEIDSSGAPLRGIVHAAGVPGYQAITEMDLNTLNSVLRPKVMGAWILDRLTQDMSLDFFISFSSIASVWGSKGQAHYAAANHFLDVLAHHRCAHGLSGLSLNWGPWSGGGMTTSEALTWLTQMGIKALRPDVAVKAIGYLMEAGCIQATLANIDWMTFKGLYEARGRRPLLEHIEVQSEGETKPQSAERSKMIMKLEQVLPNERWNILITYLQEEVANVLGLSSSQLPEPQQGFFDMGMDSLMAIELKTRMEAQLGASLPSTLAFDSPTIERLAKDLFKNVFNWELPAAGHPGLKRDESKHVETLSVIKQLSDEEVEVSIARKLAKLETLVKEN